MKLPIIFGNHAPLRYAVRFVYGRLSLACRSACMRSVQTFRRDVGDPAARQFLFDLALCVVGRGGIQKGGLNAQLQQVST